MRVTIQVHIKQLHPRIPPSITCGSVPLAHKFNIFCHTHRGEGGVMTPWLWRPHSTSTSPTQQLHQNQSLGHSDILLVCSSPQSHSLSLNWISEGYEIHEIWDMGTAPSVVTISITQPGLGETDCSPFIKSQRVLFSCTEDKWHNGHLQTAKLPKVSKRQSTPRLLCA